LQEWSFTIRSAGGVGAGDTIEFRVTSVDGDTVTDPGTFPMLTISAAPIDLTAASAATDAPAAGTGVTLTPASAATDAPAATAQLSAPATPASSATDAPAAGAFNSPVWWKCDEGSGSPITDENNSIAATASSPQWVTNGWLVLDRSRWFGHCPEPPGWSDHHSLGQAARDDQRLRRIPDWE
jgi:hypothetical protein